MRVQHLAFTDRNPLADDAQMRVPEKMPAVTAIAPDVVFGVGDGHSVCHLAVKK
jgi:hypothetical protein